MLSYKLSCRFFWTDNDVSWQNSPRCKRQVVIAIFNCMPSEFHLKFSNSLTTIRQVPSKKLLYTVKLGILGLEKCCGTQVPHLDLGSLILCSWRFQVKINEEPEEELQVDPFSSLPPTMSSLIVANTFTSLAFDHQPSSMPSSPFHNKQRPPRMGSLNRSSSRRLVSSAYLWYGMLHVLLSLM